MPPNRARRHWHASRLPSSAGVRRPAPGSTNGTPKLLASSRRGHAPENVTAVGGHVDVDGGVGQTQNLAGVGAGFRRYRERARGCPTSAPIPIRRPSRSCRRRSCRRSWGGDRERPGSTTPFGSAATTGRPRRSCRAPHTMPARLLSSPTSTWQKRIGFDSRSVPRDGFDATDDQRAGGLRERFDVLD